MFPAGIRHDDYDYGEVNQLLERSLKSFIKTTACYPERMTKEEYNNVLKEFHHSEKVKLSFMQVSPRKNISSEVKFSLGRLLECEPL